MIELADPPLRRHRSGRVLVLALFASAFLFGLQRIRFGINVSDEGMYLTAPMRYALGDVPFRDEFLNPMRMFDIVLWPLFELWPEITVYQLRLLWLIVQVACALAVYWIFKGFAPRVLPALACVATLYLANLIWTPGYHLMGTFLFALAWSLWLTACLSSRRSACIGLGAGSGLVFYVASLSYLPLLVVEIIPGLVLASRIRRGASADGKSKATAAHIATLVLLWLLTLLAFWRYHVLLDWLSAQSTVLTSEHYRSSLAEKLLEFLRQSRPFLIPFGASAMGTLGLVALGSSSNSKVSRSHDWSRTAALCVASGSLLVALILLFETPAVLPRGIPDVPVFLLSFRIFSVVLGLHAGVWIYTLFQRDAGDDGTWRFVYTMMFAASLLLAFLHGLLSGMAFKAMFATLPLFVPAVVMLYRTLLGAVPGRRAEIASVLLAATICIGVGIGSCSLMLKPPYGDAPFARLTQEFENPRMVGIWSSPAKVEQLDGVSAWLSERMKEGDFLLVGGNSSLLYFMTRTRPAIDHSWSTRSIAKEVRRSSLRKMIAQDRVPEYAVSERLPMRLGGSWKSSRGDPVHGFIFEHYRLEARFGKYGVWELQNDRF